MATPTPIPALNPPQPGRPASLWLVLALTFLGSIGTGAVTNGIFFITSSGLGYGRRENLWLGVVFGVTYIAAAMLAGPGLRALARRSARVTTRGATAAVLALMGLACLAPLAARETAPDLVGLSVWAMVLVYSPATGVLWPVVESYVSGGRAGQPLRWAIGRFNIVWSAALVAAYFGMAPLLEHRPFWILAGLGVIHLGMAGLLFALPPEPARHGEDHEPHPASYEALLALFRVLLFSSYLILSAVNPIQPIILERLGVRVAWWMPLASVWLAVRVLVFVLFERWHGWHGRWWTPWAGLAAMAAGFALTVGSPVFGAGVGIGVFAGGLALMGAGIAAIYCGALYYAMAVGSAGVDAGGKHEAVIGMGYTVGPMLGLMALGLGGTTPDGTQPDPEAFRWWTIALVGVAACGTGFWGWRTARVARARARS